MSTDVTTTSPGRTARNRAHPDDYAEFAPLFQRLADPDLTERQRHALRDELVLAHLPVAEHIALRFRHRGQPAEDLRQVAVIGLIHAVARFDPARGSDFLSYAVPTITGEIRRYFRDSTWSLRVPRRLQERHAALAATAETLYRRLNRAPRPSELAAELGIDVADVREGLLAGYAYQCVSLEQATSPQGHATHLERLSETDDNLAAVDDRHTLYPALATLPERERTIIVLRFFENLTQSQIAERVGLSQMHVSRLLNTTLRRLRSQLNPADPVPRNERIGVDAAVPG